MSEPPERGYLEIGTLTLDEVGETVMLWMPSNNLNALNKHHISDE